MRPFTSNQILIGGCLLAFGASFLNTGFLLSTGTSVSHLTGDIARIGSGLSSLGKEDGFHIINVVTATFGFILGSIISGFLLHHPTLEISKPYGRILSALGLSLVVAHYLYSTSPVLSIAVAGVVCGVQNALASRYRGVVLRTTHLTGLFTDFGIYFGMKLRGHTIDAWKLSIPIFITISFLIGAIASSAYMLNFKASWMLATGSGYLLGGITWSLYKRQKRA